MVEKEETDTLWEELKKLAVEQQQCFYELLPECTVYESKEHKYLKQNIGNAIYGPPMNKDATNNTDAAADLSCSWKLETPDNADIADIVEYSKEATEVINTIYNQLCESDPSKPVYYGVIYNIMFRPKMKEKSKKKESRPSKVTDDKKTEAEKEMKEENMLLISSVPVFTFRKSISKKSNNAQNANKNGPPSDEDTYETQYVDTSGRVYMSWTDYKTKNTLPKCTMVLPKDGIYQPDPTYPITEDYSTVWLEIEDSPACTLTVMICNGIDIASSVAGLGSVGLSIAALFTPLAPVAVITGLVATGACGVWTIGRCSHQLVDRKIHRESVHILNKEAFGQWLGIVGTTVGLGAVGGTVAISAAAARGTKISTMAINMFNVVQGSNIVINGIGIAYQGYCIVDKYRKGESVRAEALNFVLHAMFFTGSVMKVQFANDIIRDTQGKVINDYKNSITKKRLRNKFNRIVRKAADKNMCKISENAEVLQYIKHRQELPNVGRPVSGTKKLDSIPRNIVWSFDQGKLKVNDIVLLDPVQYVINLMNLGIFITVDQKGRNLQSNSQCVDDPVADKIMQLLCDLMTKFYANDNCSKNMPIVPDFEPLIKQMRSMRVNEDIFKNLFAIAESLIRRSKTKGEFILKALVFVWQYCQANLKQWGINSLLRRQSVSGSNILQKIVVAVFEAIDMMLKNLCNAFVMSLNANLIKV